MKLHQDEKMIICLEGIVGAGKTTQIEKLHQYFAPESYLIPELNELSPMKEVREKLRRMRKISNLSKKEVVELAKARGQIHKRLLNETNRPLILMDRGIYTAMVFESGNLSMWETEEISKDAGVIVPDICFVLHCSAQKSLERVDERRRKVGKYAHRAFHENEDFINKTKERYFEIARYRPIILVETSGTVNEVQERILGELSV